MNLDLEYMTARSVSWRILEEISAVNCSFSLSRTGPCVVCARDGSGLTDVASVYVTCTGTDRSRGGVQPSLSSDHIPLNTVQLSCPSDHHIFPSRLS